VDNTILHALDELCIAATKGTKETVEYFLTYCAPNQSVEITFMASEKILTIYSDAHTAGSG
jgi:hypothetical protein